jgi:N-carbamoyl-L-amino-acid hydrolase
VWAGAMSLEAAWALQDAQGISVKAELERLSQMGEDTPRLDVHAAFELHIEQGPILEAEAYAIGIVTGVQHMCRYRVTISGQETHAGPSPMAMRRDPMMAVARILPGVYAIAEQHAPASRATFGFIEAHPGSPNTVPGEVVFTMDLRHPDAASYQQMQQDVEALVRESCEQFDLGCELDRTWEAPGVTFNEACVNSVRTATQQFDYPAMEMISGAGHDACNISAVAPISMIFIPCRDGLSHNEAEAIELSQAEAGANILLHAMLDSAG